MMCKFREKKRSVKLWVLKSYLFQKYELTVRNDEQRKREGANHFPQSKFLIYYRWITDIEDHVVAVYVITNDAICLRYCIIASISYIMRICKGVVVEVAFIHDLKTDLIRNHPMWPEEFVCCWNIPIKSKKWIANLAKYIEHINK